MVSGMEFCIHWLPWQCSRGAAAAASGELVVKDVCRAADVALSPAAPSEPPPASRIEVADVPVSCRRRCSQVSKPVCGSDGNTYENGCLLEVASCRARSEGGRSVYLQYGGSCGALRSHFPSQSLPLRRNAWPAPF